MLISWAAGQEVRRVASASSVRYVPDTFLHSPLGNPDGSGQSERLLVAPSTSLATPEMWLGMIGPPRIKHGGAKLA